MQKFRKANKLKTPYKESADSVEFDFTNGSVFDVVGGKMRGGRRNSGIFEEVIDQDSVYINETIIPLLNTTRRDRKGRVNPYEPQSSKIFVTTAGYQGTFAHDKLVETLCYSLIEPDKYIVIGGSYRIPVMHGLLSEATMREILSSPSYQADQVDREYRSRWSGSMTGAAFEANEITNLRKAKRAEYKCDPAIADGTSTDFYVISCDIAKDGSANTAVIIGHVSIGDYKFRYKFCNLFTIDSTDFEEVANVLKQTVLKYQARLLIYDANGVGAGLRDWLNKKTYTKDHIELEPLGIINPPAAAEKNVAKVRDKTRNICFEIKSGGSIGSQIHSTLFSRMGDGSIRFLVKSAEAINMLEKNAKFALAPKSRKDTIMRPYFYTDRMELEMKNLDIKDVSDTVSKNILIERRNKSIQKDFFSAAEYLIYGTMQCLEIPYYKKKREKERKRTLLKISGAMRNTKPGGTSLDARRRSR